MPMKPRKGESQSDFMSRCVPEAIGTGESKRPQDQAVAICYDYWRSAHGGKKPKQSEAEVQRIIALWQKIIAKQADVPEPDEGESKQDFMDRCISELSDLDDPDAEDACELAWEDYQSEMGRESGGKSVVHKLHATEGKGMEFILSDATPDRFGDIVEVEGWQFANFSKNPVALFNHRADFPIGTWSAIRIGEKALRGNLILAPKGISER